MAASRRATRNDMNTPLPLVMIVRWSLSVAPYVRAAPIGTWSSPGVATGTYARVVDMRWIVPLPVDDIVREANVTGRTLVVDETRASGGISEGVVTALVDRGYAGRLARVTSKDSFIPLGDAAKLVLLSEDEIEAAAYRLLHS